MDENKLGLYKKLKIEKIKKDLDEIQLAGKESILLIAHRLIKELVDQGYDVNGVGTEAYFSIFQHGELLDIFGHKFEVAEGDK